MLYKHTVIVRTYQDKLCQKIFKRILNRDFWAIVLFGIVIGNYISAWELFSLCLRLDSNGTLKRE